MHRHCPKIVSSFFVCKSLHQFPKITSPKVFLQKHDSTEWIWPDFEFCATFAKIPLKPLASTSHQTDKLTWSKDRQIAFDGWKSHQRLNDSIPGQHFSELWIAKMLHTCCTMYSMCADMLSLMQENSMIHWFRDTLMYSYIENCDSLAINIFLTATEYEVAWLRKRYLPLFFIHADISMTQARPTFMCNNKTETTFASTKTNCQHSTIQQTLSCNSHNSGSDGFGLNRKKNKVEFEN